MKIEGRLTTLGLLIILAGALVYPAGAQRSPQQPAGAHPKAVLSSVPLSFEPNQGQTDSAVRFLARGDGYALFLTPKEAVFRLRGAAAASEPAVLRMELLGANGAAQISGAERLTGTVNYFIGKDPQKWHSGVSTYGQVNYRGIYPGVDAVFYGNQRELEYDFTVAPGADVKQIALRFTGAQPKLDRDGNVILALDGDHVVLHKPVVYQGEGAARKTVDGRYVVAGNRVDFQIGPYDHNQILVIDPVLSYLTYLSGTTTKTGGAGTTTISCKPNGCANGVPEGQGLAVDGSGNVYVTGLTYANDFPTQDPYQATNKSPSQWSAYVTKLNATGTGLVYSTYLGGTGNDAGVAIAVDATSSAYVGGATSSGDFPTTSGSYMANCPLQSPGVTYCQTTGAAGFLTKLSPDGQSLAYSTYLVAAGFQTPINALAVDAQGQAYVAGNTAALCSAASPGGCFPETANALLPEALWDQSHNAHTSNPGTAFLSVFSADGSSLLYSTLYGDSDPSAHGSYGDNTLSWTRASGVAVDAAGNFYLAGYAQDPHLPVTANAFQPTLSVHATAYRGFVAKFSPVSTSGGPQLLYGTYLGGTNTTQNVSDTISGVVADATGSAYVTGNTGSRDFPVTPGAYDVGPCSTSTYCQATTFLTKLEPDGSGLVWSTFVDYPNTRISAYHAGSQMISPPRLDAKGNVYVEGQSNLGYPVLHPVQTLTDANQKLSVTKFDPTGSKIFFSSLLGGSGASVQYPAGVAVDPLGNIYIAGMTVTGDLPVTPGAFQTTFPFATQAYAGFVAKIYPFFDTTTAVVVEPTTVNLGQPVTFTATVDADNHGTATGTVNFMNGSTLLGSGTVDALGTATFYTSDLSAGVYSVTAAYMGDDTFAPSTSSAQSLNIIGVTPQTITFAGLPNVTYGVAPIPLGATASSGLPVSYEVTGPATLNGSILTVTGVGTVEVTASQAGNATFEPATPVGQSFTVAPAALTVTANNASRQYGAANPSFTYNITGFVNGDTATVVSGTATETTTATSTSPAGTYPITFSAESLVAANYTFTYVNGTLTVSGGAAQSITFGPLSNVTYGVSAIPLGATASSGLSVSYGVTGPATVSGSLLTITGAGMVTVTANQAGNANYAAATPVSQSFTVAPAVLTVRASNASRQYGAANPSFTYNITGFVNGDTATVVSGTATETTTATSTSPAGTYPITFSAESLVAANYTFTYVNGTLTVSGGAAQSITFGPLSNVTYGVSAIPLGATASSGLSVSYGVTGPATVSGSLLTITGAGTVTVTANQAGNANYAAATPVSQMLTVNKGVLRVTANNASRPYGAANPTFTYNITGYVNGDTAAVVSGTATETTTATTTSPAGTYPITFSAGNLVAANYTFTYVNGTLTVSGGAAQSITFNPLPDVTYGVGRITLTATASSGLPVNYTATGPATVAGSLLTITGTGTVTVTASQPGNASYAAATPVSRSFKVLAASGGFAITPLPPAETIVRGMLGGFILRLNSMNGFGGAVTLNCSGGPAGSICRVLPKTVMVHGIAYAVAEIVVPRYSKPGTYTITFTGVSGSLTSRATARFTVR